MLFKVCESLYGMRLMLAGVAKLATLHKARQEVILEKKARQEKIWISQRERKKKQH